MQFCGKTIDMKDTDKFDTNIDITRNPDRAMNLSPPQTGKVLSIAGIVMLAALIIGAFIAVAPSVKSKIQMDEVQAKRIEALEQELATVKATTPPTDNAKPSWQNFLPDDVKQKFETVTNDVQNLSNQAATLKQAVTDLQSGSMPERLQKLETHMGAFLNVEQQANLSAMFDRVQMMGQSVSGQQSIDGALTAIMGAMAVTPHDPEKAINDVRTINPDVAKTLDGVAPEDVQAATMLLALTQFRGSLGRNNDSFDTDLSILKNTLAKDNPELQSAIDRLAPQAKIGVLTPDGLSRELRGMTNEIVEASLTGKDISVKEKAMARLSDLIKVEKNGVPITGNETQLTIVQAQKMLDTGDVAGAVKTLQTLDGAAATKTAPLLDQANATLAAQQLQTLLGQNMVGQLQNTIKSLANGGAVNTQGLQNIIAQVQQMIPGQGVIYNSAGKAEIYVPPQTLPNR